MKSILFFVIIICVCVCVFLLFLSAFVDDNEKLTEEEDDDERTHRTNNALSVSRHEMYDGRSTFFVSSPQIKKQRPKHKTTQY
jgi:uncharacterized protein YxeA